MSDLNQVVIQGRLVRDPDYRTTPSGTPVCDFKIASNRRKRNKTEETDNKNQFATFVKVTLWNQDADYWSGKANGSSLKIGDEVLVTGQLFDDNFVREDGTFTSGRIRVDNAHVRLIRRGNKTTQE